MTASVHGLHVPEPGALAPASVRQPWEGPWLPHAERSGRKTRAGARALEINPSTRKAELGPRGPAPRECSHLFVDSVPEAGDRSLRWLAVREHVPDRALGGGAES